MPVITKLPVLWPKIAQKLLRRAIRRCPEQSFAGLSRCKGGSQRFLTHCSNSCQGRLSHCKDQAQGFATRCSNGCRERISRWAQTAIWLQFMTFARTSFCLGKVLFKFCTSSADIGTDFLQSKLSIPCLKIKSKIIWGSSNLSGLGISGHLDRFSPGQKGCEVGCPVRSSKGFKICLP